MKMSVLGEQEVFSTSTVSVVKRSISVDGRVIEREGIRLPDQAIVLAVDNQGNALLVRSFYPGPGCFLWAPIQITLQSRNPEKEIRDLLSARLGTNAFNLTRLLTCFSSPSVMINNLTHFTLARFDSLPLLNRDEFTILPLNEILSLLTCDRAADTRSLACGFLAVIKAEELGIQVPEWSIGAGSNYMNGDALPRAELIEEKILHEGRVIKLIQRKFALPNGERTFELMRRKDGVIIVPVNSEGEFVLTKEVVAGLEEPVLSLPGGKIESTDPRHLSSEAQRELQEETGFSADEMVPLPICYSDQFVARTNFYFLATKLRASELESEEDEYLDVISLSPDDTWRHCLRDLTTTPGTVAFLLLADKTGRSLNYLKPSTCRITNIPLWK